jgi:hypothetical protein
MNATGEETKEERAVRCRATICGRNVEGACSLEDIARGDTPIIPDENGRCEDYRE